MPRSLPSRAVLGWESISGVPRWDQRLGVGLEGDVTPDLSQAQPLAMRPPRSVGMPLPDSWAPQSSGCGSVAGNQPGQLRTRATPLIPLKFRQFAGGVPDPSSAQISQKGTNPLELVLPTPHWV